MPKKKVKAQAKGGVAKAAPLFPAGEYKCPKCNNKGVVFVNMSMPPACTKHTGGAVIMEEWE